MIEMIDELETNMSHRGKAYNDSKLSSRFQDDSKSVLGNSDEVTRSLYCKSSEGTKV